ncbi:hypothetical protein QFC22_006243 [Naganishia vaughanmartiniae]|uniref:Uncharacterized protein n=1 Tax=Naganishia vaughanmartiniae TaxID=1424756 RepID=A0ACC2WNV2_9TREE|nr:hypothetical protein QFC22_006243 [Naganishia vaughanmartiniae]
MLRKGVLLDQYRKENYAYFEEEYNRCWKANRAPTAYRGKKDGKANMKGMVWEIIQNLFRPHSDIPYQIDHWEVDGEWKGMGLFTTCETTTGNIGRAFKEYEPDNCQLLWAPATLEYYESIYTCKWMEKKKGAREKGWYLKKDFVKEETDTHYRLEAPFFLYGILMFANHGDRAPFFFREFKPIPPSNNKGRMFGFVTIELHDDSWDYPVPAGHQILIHYDHNMTCFGQKPVLDLDEVVGEGDVEVTGMTPLTLTAAEEQMQVMEEMIEEKDNADDSDYQPEIVVGVGYRVGRRFRSRARRRPDSSQSD